MTRRLSTRPQARIELIEAAVWYDEQQAGLGRRLVLAFDEAVARIVRSPHGYQIIGGGIRRASLRTFPYGVMYRVTDDEIVIVGCVHHSRDPVVWQNRN